MDVINDYYDPKLKIYRLREINNVAADEKTDVDNGLNAGKFTFVKGNLDDKAQIDELFFTYHFDVVVNLVAQAGVRYSITNPDAYIESNMLGFYNLLEANRHSYDNGKPGVEHFVYASSSSVYGSNKSTIQYR